jgi:hypothetical protein
MAGMMNSGHGGRLRDSSLQSTNAFQLYQELSGLALYKNRFLPPCCTVRYGYTTFRDAEEIGEKLTQSAICLSVNSRRRKLYLDSVGENACKSAAGRAGLHT